MEPEDNVNRPLANQGEKNPNPPQPLNINTKIDEVLATLRTILDQLKDTKGPRRVSLATSLDVIVRSIASAQGELTSIYEYMERMFEYYNTRLDINQVRDLGISKKQVFFVFRDPRNGQELHMNKKCICINMCIHPKISKNLMDRWYMVFDKPPCNNMEV
jgi:hypothetical protein